MRILGDKVFIEVASSEEVTESGIILAAAKAERKYEGKVIGIGDHEDIAKLGVNIGDYVWYVPGMNTEFIENGKICDVVSIYDIIAKGE